MVQQLERQPHQQGDASAGIQTHRLAIERSPCFDVTVYERDISGDEGARGSIPALVAHAVTQGIRERAVAEQQSGLSELVVDGVVFVAGWESSDRSVQIAARLNPKTLRNLDFGSDREERRHVIH